MVQCVGHAGVRDPLAQPRRAVCLVHLNVLVGLRALPCSTTVSQPCAHSTAQEPSVQHLGRQMAVAVPNPASTRKTDRHLEDMQHGTASSKGA